MKNTSSKDETQAGDQLGSCENNVSMFDLFENHPDRKTVEETHEMLSKNFIPGETFAEVTNKIAQNRMKNTFAISLNKENKIRLSSGFTLIKSGKRNLSSQSDVCKFLSRKDGKTDAREATGQQRDAVRILGSESTRDDDDRRM